MERLLDSPEAKLAALNALVSLGWAFFTCILLTGARQYGGPLPLAANYYFTMTVCFILFTGAYVLRTLSFMGIVDPIIVSVPGSFILGFVFIAAVQLGCQSEEQPGRISRVFHSIRLPADRFAEFLRLPGHYRKFLSYYGVGVVLIGVQVILLLFARCRWWSWSPWWSAEAFAVLDCVSLWLLALALVLYPTVPPLVIPEILGLFLYGGEQFLGIPGNVFRIDATDPDARKCVVELKSEFAGMAFAVLGKFPLAFGLVLVSYGDIVKRERARVKTIKQLATLGLLFTSREHQLPNTLKAILDDVRELKAALATGDSRQALAVADDVKTATDLALQQVKSLCDHDLSTLQPQQVDLCGAIRRARALVSEPANVTIDCGDPVEGIRVEGNAELLAEVFRNLLQNAVDAIPESRNGRVAVSAKLEEKAGASWVTVRVEDNGRGIDETIKEHLFEPRPPSQSPFRLGVGLWLARSYVYLLLNGQLDLEKTVVGGGSTFLVALPAATLTTPVVGV